MTTTKNITCNLRSKFIIVHELLFCDLTIAIQSINSTINANTLQWNSDFIYPPKLGSARNLKTERCYTSFIPYWNSYNENNND